MKLDTSTERSLIELVRKVSREELVPRFRRLHPDAVRTKTAFDDLVTEADLAVEKALTEGVRRLLPAAAVVGEEAVAADPTTIEQIQGAELAVIIDPIDGTWNYANGLAIHGVLLAVTQNEKTTFGLLYDPVMDDWVLARQGGGAWYCSPDQEPVQLFVSDDKPLGSMTGFLSPFSFPPAQRAAIDHAALCFARAHTLRCACHEYRLLIEGKVDFYINSSAKPWDHAAGVLAVQEAGGSVGMMDGREYTPTIRDGCIVAANSHQALYAIRRHFTDPAHTLGMDTDLRWV